MQKCLELVAGKKNQTFAFQLPLMLLPAEINIILEKKCCKKNMVRSFYSSGGKIVFALLTEIIADHVIITLIKTRKAYLEKILNKTFCSCGFSFHYCLNDILYIFICINFLLGSKASNGSY